MQSLVIVLPVVPHELVNLQAGCMCQLTSHRRCTLLGMSHALANRHVKYELARIVYISE